MKAEAQSPHHATPMPLHHAAPMPPRYAAPSQQTPQPGATPRTEEIKQPQHAPTQPPRHAAPSQLATKHGAMHMTGNVHTPHHAAPSQYGAAPAGINQTTRQKQRHTAGDTRNKGQAFFTGTIAKHAHAQDAPRNVRSYPLLGLSQETQMGHSLPVALMPTRQQSRPQALAQHYIIGKQMHNGGMDPCKNVQNQSVAAAGCIPHVTRSAQVCGPPW